jgi:hexosaminidase
MKLTIACIFTLLFVALASARAQSPTDLFLRGYSVIPTPQKVELQSQDIEFQDAWAYDAGKLARNHIAIRSLLGDLQASHQFELRPAANQSQNILRLAVSNGAAPAGNDPEIARQGYRLKIAPGLIEITGASDQGLFYGVQTLLQLLKPGARGRLLLPVATIEDWPKLQLRFLHWDTKHHQDRIETLKRYLDWSARFKINMIAFELEDKFEYPTNPVIGAPGAFTSAELQEIVDYGLERFIQVTPNVQAPAHMAYVLKHPQFAHLRADGNNYQACLCDEESYKLIFQMYDDVIKATKGVDYLYVSTDEVYYAGICAKCDKPYNEETRSLKWVEFVRRARDFAASRSRRILVWGEYPLLPQHVRMLPPDVIDGVMGEEEYLKGENELGMRQLIYTSMQGAELLFPNHLSNYQSAGGDQGPSLGRIKSTIQGVASSRVWQGKPIGVFGAAWDDSGLHNETFWLGWAAVAETGWRPNAPPAEQVVAEFMNIYYGPRVSEMVEVYRGLQAQARFFESSWDRIISKARNSGYGNSYGKGRGTTRFDQTLPQPAMPAMPGLSFTPVYVGRYEKLVEDARRMALENDALIHRINQNMTKADRNRYNLEVFLSIAELAGHHNRLIYGLKSIEDKLKAARGAAERNDPQQAVGQLVAAYDQARGIVEERYKAFRYLKATWEKSRLPKGREINGKKFYHVLDDTKDHWADRRPDLSYMVAPEESIELEKWLKQLASVIEEYARKNNVHARALAEPRLEN